MRWAVGTADKHSLSWGVRVDAHPEGGAEVYIYPREISQGYHVSLHRSGRRHVRVGAARALGYRPAELTGPEWERPKEIAAGITLAFRIVVPPAALSRTHPIKDVDTCTLIPPPSDGKSVEVAFVVASAPWRPHELGG